MCHHVTLIAPTSDAARLSAGLRKHGRTADPLQNLFVGQVLRPGEHQYLTSGFCDCGTVLFHPTRAEHNGSSRQQRKGWSEARIARASAAANQSKARRKLARRSAMDSLELWVAVLSTLEREIRLPYAGLLLHFYAKDVATKRFVPVRKEVSRDMPARDVLSVMQEDELLIFPFRAG
jgi:hypothetical protein